MWPEDCHCSVLLLLFSVARKCPSRYSRFSTHEDQDLIYLYVKRGSVQPLCLFVSLYPFLPRAALVRPHRPLSFALFCSCLASRSCAVQCGGETGRKEKKNLVPFWAFGPPFSYGVFFFSKVCYVSAFRNVDKLQVFTYSVFYYRFAGLSSSPSSWWCHFLSDRPASRPVKITIVPISYIGSS